MTRLVLYFWCNRPIEELLNTKVLALRIYNVRKGIDVLVLYRRVLEFSQQGVQCAPRMLTAFVVAVKHGGTGVTLELAMYVGICKKPLVERVSIRYHL